MNILDYLMLIPAIWFGYKGLKNGLIAELTSILGLFIGLWAISKIIPTLNLWFGDNKMTKFIAIIILFILVIVIVYFLGKIVEKIVSLVIPKLFNYLFGLLFGILKVVLAFTMIFYFINAIDHKGFLFKQKIKKESLFYPYIEPIAEKIISWRDIDKKDIENHENHN